MMPTEPTLTPRASVTNWRGDPRVKAIAAAASHMVALRDAWFNPPALAEVELK